MERKCPHCGSTHIHSKGYFELKNGDKIPRFKCQECSNPTFSTDPVRDRETAETRQKAKCIQLYLEGLPQNQIARVARISKSKVNELLKEFPGLEKYRLERNFELLTEEDWKRTVAIFQDNRDMAYSSGILYIGEKDHEIWGVRTKRKDQNR